MGRAFLDQLGKGPSDVERRGVGREQDTLRASSWLRRFQRCSWLHRQDEAVTYFADLRATIHQLSRLKRHWRAT